MWEERVEKAIDIKVKASLQQPFLTRENDSRCPKHSRPSANKKKDEDNEQHENVDIAKFYNLCLANKS